jgi:hypothetical protein
VNQARTRQLWEGGDSASLRAFRGGALALFP